MTLREQIEDALAKSIVDVPDVEAVVNAEERVATPDIALSTIVAYVWRRQATLETWLLELADRLDEREQ